MLSPLKILAAAAIWIVCLN